MLAPQTDRLYSARATEPWFIVQTEPRRETTAETSLKREDFTVWYPIVKVWVRLKRNRMSHSQRRRALNVSSAVQVDKPLFPGYMFIQRGPRSPGLAALWDLTAVRGIVHFGENVAMLDNRLVDKIRSDVEGGLLDQHHAVTPFAFKINDQARVTEGVFSGHNVIVEKIDPKTESIHVLANLFGRACRVALSADHLEKP